MPEVFDRQLGDRRQFVSRRFKRQIAVRLTAVGLLVLAAVCLAFGAVGIGVGIGALTGIAVLIYVQRRRRWSEMSRIPSARQL